MPEERIRAAYRARACAAGIACGAQIFSVGAGLLIPRLLKRRIPRRPACAHPLRNRCLLRPKASGFGQTRRASAHRKSAAHSAESDAAFLLCVAALRRGRLYPADPPAAGASDDLPDADARRRVSLRPADGNGRQPTCVRAQVSAPLCAPPVCVAVPVAGFSDGIFSPARAQAAGR